jgi:hypothetical protein
MTSTFSALAHPSVNHEGCVSSSLTAPLTKQCQLPMPHVLTCMAAFTFKRLASKRLHIVLAVGLGPDQQGCIVC